MKRWSVLFLAVLAAACGHSGSGPSAAPVITNLTVTPLTPERAGGTVRYRFVVDFTDLQGDVFQGQCEISTNLGTTSGTISIIGPGFDPTATTARVRCERSFLALIPQDIVGAVTLIDHAGHRSNSVDFRLGIR